MIRHDLVPALVHFLLGVLVSGVVTHGQAAAQVEYFERHIRPVLADKCYRCHGPDELESGLNLTHRDGLLVGGDRGPAIAPGNVEGSLLMKALRYDDGGLQMPPEGRLAAEVIARFEEWVAMGAPDPRDSPSGASVG